MKTQDFVKKFNIRKDAKFHIKGHSYRNVLSFDNQHVVVAFSSMELDFMPNRIAYELSEKYSTLDGLGFDQVRKMAKWLLEGFEQGTSRFRCIDDTKRSGVLAAFNSDLV